MARCKEAVTPRRRVNPTTCERDYTADEREFLMALDRYKRVCRRPYPTFTEVLEIVVSLGYRKVAPKGSLPGCHC